MAVTSDFSQVGIMGGGERRHSHCSDLRSLQKLELERQQEESTPKKLR